MTDKLFINGQWQPGHGTTFQSTDPVYQSVLWEGKSANNDDVNQAVAAARQAFKHWSKTNFDQRLTLLEKFKGLLETKKDQLALQLAQENGKPIWEAKTEIAGMIGKLNLSVQAYQERTGEKSSENNGIRANLRHRPHGVIAVFGPFNFPGHLPNGHIIPALLAGNTIVFKPSDQTPRFADITVKLWQEAGLPDGVINLVQGQADTGKALASHPDINGLFFTGSSTVGKLLHKQFGGHPEKILALEMGGNNPLIIWEADDLKAAAYHTIQSAFITSGQRCVCARRLIIPEGPAGDAILAELVSLTQSIHIDAYDAEPQPFIASMISSHAAHSILQAEAQLQAQGGKSLLTMKHLQANTGIVTPGIIDVTAISQRQDTEHFGPLLQVIRVNSFEAAIDEANHTQYGLSAGLFSDNPARFNQYLLQSRAGIVNWNRQTTGASGTAPFGGIGCSGNHRPSAYYAADYCAYPVASIESDHLVLPEQATPGIGIC